MDEQNPYRPYTQQNADWEQQRRAQQDAERRRFQDNVHALERQNAEQLERIRGAGDPVIRPTTPTDPRVKGGGGGLAVLGGVLGFFLAPAAGLSVVGGIILGALAGALLIPVLRLVGWFLKVIIWGGIILLVLVLLEAALSN